MSSTWWQAMYDDIDNKRFESLEARFTEDVVVTLAGNPPAVGRDVAMAEQREFMESFRSLRHQFTNTWEVDDTAILEGVVTYERHDGKTVEIPGATVVTRSGDLVDTVRIYLDLAPLYA
ncbi:SnoaL-like domain-containing protein [Lentzea fradiae]|uniref:SnoaL-like domain-containing protein n=1 Tax=Lentzea fradiae TaxID=200378 RepID=A0A1G7LC76_9PSEU|nr:nuclear transport factor 2 family protein [Lentzea fradiae]SDF46914.1 SnoaL-like domain-containing protein [Lentzea fradiae]